MAGDLSTGDLPLALSALAVSGEKALAPDEKPI